MIILRNEKTWVKTVLLASVLFTLTVNLVAVFKYQDYFLLGSMEKMNNDDVKYIRTAKILLEKGMLTDSDTNKPTAAEMPGHAVMLAGCMKVFGYDNGVVAFRVVQACLQALSIFLLFLIGTTVFNGTVAILACVLSSFYVADIVSTGLIMMEVACKFLLLLLIYISIYAVKTKKTGYYIWGGLVWGIACLVRPTIATFPVVIFGLWLIQRYSFKEMLKYTLVTSAVFAMVMMPWWIRNYRAFDRFIPLALASGNPFLQGTYINYDQTRDFMGYMPGANAVETDRIEMETGIRRLETYFPKYPMEYVQWYTIGKARYLWRYPYYWKEVFGISFNQAAEYHMRILITAALGIVAACLGAYRQRNAVLILTIVYFTAIHLPYFTFARYAYPVMPIVILLSAYEIYLMLGLLRLQIQRGMTYFSTVKMGTGK